ncbi:hypothetical protein [Palleronia caenipelagi]|uniref:hypothetical protein n=1 Tax=Palleronia caenipelagi TaxID=2489174 RepID=UPI00115E247C|nr:hypothetical protein [Palleronia caenipelagi]
MSLMSLDVARVHVVAIHATIRLHNTEVFFNCSDGVIRGAGFVSKSSDAFHPDDVAKKLAEIIDQTDPATRSELLRHFAETEALQVAIGAEGRAIQRLDLLCRR